MNRTAIVAVGLALLTSAPVLAQTEPAPPNNPAIGPVPDLQSTPQSIEIPPPPPAEPDFDAPVLSQEDDDAERDDGRHRRPELRRDRIAGHGWRHFRRHHGMGYHGPHHHAPRDFRDGSRGGAARFTFSQGDGSPSVTIKCAEGDTTLECANAVMPLLERFLPGVPAGTTAP